MTEKNLSFVSRETNYYLLEYLKFLEKWNRRINLVSKASIKNAWDRHIVDSAQLWPFIENGNHKKWVDIGSGAGFPGLVIAAIAAEKRPNLSMVLVDSDKKKCVFMREAARVLRVSVKIISGRIEKLDSLGADVLSARALAPFPDLVKYSKLHRVEGGKSLFLKGENEYQEILKLKETEELDLQFFPSLTQEKSFIVCLGSHSGVISNGS